jgi:hypothetical protein
LTFKHLDLIWHLDLVIWHSLGEALDTAGIPKCLWPYPDKMALEMKVNHGLRPRTDPYE